MLCLFRYRDMATTTGKEFYYPAFLLHLLSPPCSVLEVRRRLTRIVVVVIARIRIAI